MFTKQYFEDYREGDISISRIMWERRCTVTCLAREAPAGTGRNEPLIPDQ